MVPLDFRLGVADVTIFFGSQRVKINIFSHLRKSICARELSINLTVRACGPKLIVLFPLCQNISNVPRAQTHSFLQTTFFTDAVPPTHPPKRKGGVSVHRLMVWLFQKKFKMTYFFVPTLKMCQI